jgi:hypothetical protein
MSNSNNNMLNHPVLPLLKHIRTIAGFAEEGVWDARHATELANLSQDIKVEKVGIDINSIPDIWARPLLFEMALFDVPASDGSYEGHLLHKRVLGEWRGLIAMLALKEAGHIQDLTALSITVPMDAAAKNSAPAFLRAAANLIPTGTNSNGYYRRGDFVAPALYLSLQKSTNRNDVTHDSRGDINRLL